LSSDTRLHTRWSLWGSIIFALYILGVTGCTSLQPAGLKRIENPDIHYVETADGWKLALERFSYSINGRNKDRLPVILCHGLGYNSKFWTIADKIDFARYLANQGFDVWLVSLRGSGASTKPGVTILKNLVRTRDREYRSASFLPSRINWKVDDYILYDIPAALNYVVAETGKPKVLWVGHSLGGMIMMGYLSRFGDDKVQAVATIGSPLIIPQPPNRILQAFVQNKTLFKAFLIVNTRTGATSIAPFHRFVITPDEVLLWNKHNVEPNIVSTVLTHVVEDIPAGVLDQVLSMVRSGQFMSYDKSFNYTEEIRKISIPLLLSCGKADNLAPPESVRYVYETVGSEDKTFMMFGTANGHREDYGHNDLILGKYAYKEVYPDITKWLKAHSYLPK
jgi:pimeloyl-ACP methyl ester carboxylesterase